MRPLVFLVSRTFINTIRRMATSPKRLISFVLVIAYYIWIVLNRWSAVTTVRRGNIPIDPATLPRLNIEIIDAILFSIFMVLSLPLLAQLWSYNRTMRAADVDVLFPTPVSPKLVMGLRVLRDYLGTLIFPFFIAILTWRPIASAGLFRNLPHPETSGYLLRTATMAWILLAMVWTVYGYAATLFVNRSDLASDRNLRIMKRSITTVVLGTLAYIAIRFRADGITLNSAVSLGHSPVLRIPYFVAHLGSMFALGPITGIWHSVVSGGALLALMGLGFALALSEVGWMYDQAAVRGFETMESMRLRRGGDQFAMMADAARRGKLKRGRETWIHRLRVPPWGAMIWREAVIQLRSFRTSMAFLLIIAIAYSLFPVFILRASAGSTSDPERVMAHASQIGWLFAVCQGFGLFMYVISTTSTGFVELLRRIDLVKPLPFSPAKLMVVEVLAKTYLPVLMSVGCTAIVLAACPYIWPFALAHLMYGPSLAAVLSSVVLVVTLLFPEIDDPTQRGFRGLMQLLGIAIVVSPGIAAYAALSYWLGSPIIGGLVGMIFNLAITVGLTVAAGYLYLGFNPTE